MGSANMPSFEVLSIYTPTSNVQYKRIFFLKAHVGFHQNEFDQLWIVNSIVNLIKSSIELLGFCP